ncbi:hypothetical protein BGX38DRAFT_94477 [Terfezia claveryi]|nr:hypothetical protein BGX38DRAFT_94477 [Terfezia claveryi]
MVADTQALFNMTLRPKSEFKYRNLLDCIKYLLRQCVYVTHMLWEPVKSFNYSVHWSLSFWCRIKRISPTSQGSRNCGPLYMSIGNIKSTVRNKPTMNAWILIALLPIPPKHPDNPNHPSKPKNWTPFRSYMRS